MNTGRNALLQKKLEENRNKVFEKNFEKKKKELAESIDGFDKKYRFADYDEARKIEEFIDKLNFSSPAHITVNGNNPVPHSNMFLCFLSGSEDHLKMYIYGDYEDLINDMDEWDFISPYLLLVDEDFVHYIYVNDYGEATEAEIR